MHIAYVCEYFENEALTNSRNLDSTAVFFVRRGGDEDQLSKFNPVSEFTSKGSGEEATMP